MIALPILLLTLVYAAPVPFTVLLCGVVFLAQLELGAMGLKAERRREQWFTALCGALTVFAMAQQHFTVVLLLLTLTLLLLSVKILFSLSDSSPEQAIAQIGWLGFGLLYVPLLMGHVPLLHQLPDGRAWIFLTLLAVMASDTAAYFTGVNFGRRKLYPLVSPNKSVEGALGGLCGAVLAVLLVKWSLLPAMGLFEAILLGLVLGSFSQVGDLFESLLKRGCGVKDSGTMIPGHGGLLDRLDSLLFAFPVTYYAARYWFCA